MSGIFLAGLVVAILTSFYWIVALPFIVLFFYLGWQQWQFIFFLLIFSLPWSVEYNFNPTLGTDLPDEPLMLLTAFLFIVYWFYKPPALSATWKHPLIFLLLVHFVWIGIATLFSADWLISLKFLAAKTWYAGAFVFTPILLFKNKKAIKIAAVIFLVSMLTLTMLSLYRHYRLGFSFANINNAVSPFFRNHVNYSAMLVCTVPVWVALFQFHKKSHFLILPVMSIVLTALFLSYARGAWLALIIGAVSYWLIKKRKLVIAFVIASVLIIASVFWIKSNDRYLEYAHDFRTTIFHKNFEEHLVATYKLKDVSTAERFNRWIAGVRMIKDEWVTGFGPNTFYYNYRPYTIPAFKTWVSDNKDHSTVHNYFLLTIIEQGIPGLLFFLLLLGGLLYYSEHLYKRVQDRFYKITAMACGVMLMMIITVNFLSDLIETDKVGSLFFLCLATLVAIDLNTRNEIRQPVS